MKKVLSILCTALLLLIFLVAFYIYDHIFYETSLFTDKTAISTVRYDEISGEDIIREIHTICETYDTEFSKYVFLDRENISVYTTNPRAYETFVHDEYMQIALPMGNKTIRIIPIEKMQETTSYDGLYYIHTIEKDIVNEITTRFNKVIGKTEVYASYGSNTNAWLSLLQDIKIYFPILILLIVSSAIMLFVIVKIAISESKTIAILRIHGQTNKRILVYMMRKYYSSILIGFLLSSSAIFITIMVKGGWRFVPVFFAINILSCTILIVFSVVLFLAIIMMIERKHQKTEIIKGNVISKKLIVMQFILKYIMLAFAAMLMVSLFSYQEKINTYMASDESWFQTENIYRVKSKFVTNDLADKRTLELSSKQLFRDLEENTNIFLINTRNFDRLSSNQLVWEANADTALYSSSGKSITVNINYLMRHPVFDINGNDVAEQIIVDENIRNILVPISLKGKEDEILKSFLEDFIFQKIDVAKIYAREIGEKLPLVEESNFRINLIYVNEDSKYFSYNKNIMSENGNLITDPIVIVDTGNVDPSFYFSWLTNSVFFESYNSEPFSDISHTVAQYDLLSAFDAVEAIYDTRADEIQSLAEAKTMTTFVIAMILLLLVFFIYLLSHSYFEQNKYAIFVKHISGYSLTRICGTKLLLEIVLDVIILSVCGNLTLAITMIAADIALTYSFSLKLYKNSASRIIKGGSIQ